MSPSVARSRCAKKANEAVQPLLRKLEEAGPEPRGGGKEKALEGAAQGAVDIRKPSADDHELQAVTTGLNTCPTAAGVKRGTLMTPALLGSAKLICMLPSHDFVARGRARAFDRGLIFNCELMIFDRGLILE